MKEFAPLMTLVEVVFSAVPAVVPTKKSAQPIACRIIRIRRVSSLCHLPLQARRHRIINNNISNRRKTINKANRHQEEITAGLRRDTSLIGAVFGPLLLLLK